jgi:hypothetical protein
MAGRRQTLILDDPRDPELEAGLVDDDAAAWLRFGAWLADQGSPRGAVVIRELADGVGPSPEDPGLRIAYSAIHRCSAAAQLARQESWQFEWRRGFPARAVFLLASTRARGARAWVEERWEQGRIDPDVTMAERVQLEHGLGLAELRFLDFLDLEISEFQDHLPLVARLLAVTRREHLRTLRLAVAHYDPVWMGADEAPEKALVTGAEAAAMLAALPRLRRLELEGHFFVPALAHAHLRELRLSGHMPVLDGGLLVSEREREDRGLMLPGLRRLELAAMNPSSGCGPPLDACLLRLDPERLPGLVELELQDSDLGDESGRGGVFATIARSPILGQLRSLRLRAVDVASDRERVLGELAPRFAHLERLVIDDISVEEARHFTAGNLTRAEARVRRDGLSYGTGGISNY